MQGIIDGFSMDDALEVKKIERVTNHDVKAVEYFLKQKCESHPEIAKVTSLSLSLLVQVLTVWVKFLCLLNHFRFLSFFILLARLRTSTIYHMV